jgi:integrase
MGTTATKPIKIKLNNGTAPGMYILIVSDEEKYTKQNETKPPNRNYKIEVAVEVMYNHKRCRGKKLFNVPKGTSIVKAVSSLLGKKDEMISTLKERGTLKIQKVSTWKVNIQDRRLDTLFEIWIANKSIISRPNTIRVYKVNYYQYISPALGKKIVDSIAENDVQAIINDAINSKKAPNTIKGIKRILKPLMETNDLLLNWSKIILPKDTSDRKYTKSKDDTLSIVNALKNYKHKVARGVFEFLLTGRRINETLYLTHDNIDYENNTFTILAKYAKTKKDFVFTLTPALLKAIQTQDTTSGRIFRLENRQMLSHFKMAMNTIGIHDMVIHDLRSMVAQTALDNGADIYDVSKMLAHQRVATTEARYVEGGVEQAAKAQKVFNTLVEISTAVDEKDIIKTDEYEKLKMIYPNSHDKMIFKIMDFMK